MLARADERRRRDHRADISGFLHSAKSLNNSVEIGCLAERQQRIGVEQPAIAPCRSLIRDQAADLSRRFELIEREVDLAKQRPTGDVIECQIAIVSIERSV